MKISDQLYVLIHSLSKSEKRYFKRFVNVHGDGSKIYLDLFDEISKVKNPNEKLLSAKFKNYYSGNFGVIKQLLMDVILKSLSSYNSESSVEHVILEQLTEIKVLQKKNLNEISLRKLKRTIKLCIENERLAFLPNLYSHQKTIYMQNLFQNVTEVDYNNLFADENYWAHQISILNSYVNLLFVFYYWSSHIDKGKENYRMKKIREVVQNPLVKVEPNTSLFSIKSIRLSILSGYFEQQNRLQQREETLDKHIKLYNSYPKIKKEFYFNYLNTCYQWVDVLILNHKYIQAIEELEKLKKETNKGSSYELLFRSLYVLNLSAVYIKTGRFDDSIKIIKKFSNEIVGRETLVPSRISQYLIYYEAVSVFNKMEHVSVIKILNGMQLQSLHNSELNFSSCFLVLLSHINLGNAELMPYMVQTTLTSFAKQGISNKIDPFYYFLKEIEKGIKSRSNVLNSVFLSKISKQVLVKLKKFKRPSPLFPFDFEAWLISLKLR